jgi:hypothetical protein
MPSLGFALAAVAALLVGANSCHAGILLPDEVGFDADDLERALKALDQGGTSSSSGQNSPQSWPPEDDNQSRDPIGLLKSSLPMGGGSSSTSTSLSGGAIGSGVVLCLLNGTITHRDDTQLGRLPEDHGLSLPAPPGTYLLRPPRNA